MDIYKLGKQAPRPIGERDMLVGKYFAEPVYPPSCHWSKPVTHWGMMLNDQLGDCAIAGPGHLIKGWTYNAGDPFDPTDAQILAAYEAVGHYDPSKTDKNGNNNTDGGCVLSDVIDHWSTKGIAGHKIAGSCRVSLTDIAQIKSALFSFGGLDIGVALPKAAGKLTEWDVPKSRLILRKKEWHPGTWGGHCVVLVDYDGDWFTCVTWGQLLKVSAAFLAAYCDEIHAILSLDWLLPNKVAPSHIDLPTLQQDLFSYRG